MQGLFFISLYFLLSMPAHAGERYPIYEGLNAWRTSRPVCQGQTYRELRPLAVSSLLEETAARRATGMPMAQAMPESIGAHQAMVFVVGGNSPSEALRRLQLRHYQQLLDPAYSHMGVVLARDRWWLVVAEMGEPMSESGSNDVPFVIDSTQTRARLLAGVNQARSKTCCCGKLAYPATTPPQTNERLNAAAQQHAEDMAREIYFAHANADGRSIADRAKETGYAYSKLGETIALSPGNDQEQVVDLWQQSSGRCVNIMNAGLTEIGIGAAAIPGGMEKWVIVFGSP